MSGQPPNPRNEQGARRPRTTEAVVASMGHVAATGLVALVGLVLVVGPAHLRALLEVELAQGMTPTRWLLPVAGHLMLSAMVWALLFFGARTLKRFSARERSPRLVRARGAVATETLIVMPVLLLLVFGLAQLAVVNIAGMLANYAAVQAGRAVWVWHPETQPLNDESARRGVTDAMVVDHARAQAAAALAPVAPGDHQMSGGEGSAVLERMRTMMMASQVESPPNDSGRMVQEAGFDAATNEDAAFWRALDGSSFPERTSRKITFAFLATEVEVITRGSEVGASLTYQHYIAFPLVGAIFGEQSSVGGRSGSFSTITREFLLPAQVQPNAETPEL
ncbi:pilus assembly protein [Lujinxingia vulgaris]|uniref:Pilus assembly protein n=1 Tax=Lujinxingia vulgaris TaxID=2600176 RepID=A0A5C6XCQ4_9DELT|nr:TadE family protein [Lujinxingia vulgaris]TXD38228.1 pilus assembly protein [Lujinxingia vulgaris]